MIGCPLKYIHGHNPAGRGPESHKWKGGRWVHKSGYVYVYAPENPRANEDGYVYEHRLVAEKQLGRYLLIIERVHHINGIKTDNRPENLVVLLVSEHAKLHGSDTFRKIRETTDFKAQCSRAGKKGSAARWHKG